MNDCMVEFRNVANFDAVWLPRWRRAGVRAYTAKKSKKKCVPTTFLKTAVIIHSLGRGMWEFGLIPWRGPLPNENTRPK